MEPIALENWELIPDNPRHIQFVGSRTAQEVYAELRQRLDSMGYLPDEYFELGLDWDNNREIPKDSEIFCTTDYGGSEGIYIDVYLKWYENNKPITESFITGKTLGESGSDMDRMFLIASAITKAFHGDSGSHDRYMGVGEAPQPEGAVVHFSGKEQRILIDALMERRNVLVENTQQVEQILRRMTGGSITSFMDEVGQTPLRVSDYDKAILAIQDGNMNVFRDTYPKVPEQIGELLIQTAGRPGTVGRQMCQILLADAKEIPNEVYLQACKNAVDTGDLERVKVFADRAEHCVGELELSLYGEIIGHAYGEGMKNMSIDLIKQSTPEQIAAASSSILYLTAMQGDFYTAKALVEKGIDTSGHAGDILHTLYASHNGWMAEHLLESGMKIEYNQFHALQSCIKNGGLKGAQLLLDRGVDFEKYMEWAERWDMNTEGHDDTLQALSEYWERMKEQDESQQEAHEMGGPVLG